MRLDEEAGKLLSQIEGPSNARELEDATELRAILREGVFELEEALKTLPSDQQEVVHILYLQKVREITCTTHIAVNALIDKHRVGGTVPDEEVFAGDPHVLPSWREIAHLYGY